LEPFAQGCKAILEMLDGGTTPMPLEEKPMASENSSNGATSPSLTILAQYTKDLSFENPGAPRSLQSRDSAPAININVNVNANPLSDTDFDVVLSLSAEAKDGDKTVFHTELVYGGVFRVAGFPQEHMLPVLFIECPRMLFPFARQIIADVTRNGGFPPLMIDPIDFSQMFAQRVAEEQTRAKVQAVPN
jgi:preprotein translocase subunit SecB